MKPQPKVRSLLVHQLKKDQNTINECTSAILDVLPYMTSAQRDEADAFLRLLYETGVKIEVKIIKELRRMEKA
jgi:hypothetical protein